MDGFFNFNSVVFFGVSPSLWNLGMGFIYNLQKLNYDGRVYAIGKEKGDANGIPIHTSLDDIDDEIDRLITELESAVLTNDTIVIVLADHGDEFWEHAAFQAAHYQSFKERQGVSHGHTLFQELIWVPLIITRFYAKGSPPSAQLPQKPAVIEHTVALVDLVPTLLDIISLSPSATFDGTSAAPLMNGITRKNSRSIFSESTASGSLKVSLIEHPYKFIYAQGETNTRGFPLPLLLPPAPNRGDSSVEKVAQHYPELAHHRESQAGDVLLHDLPSQEKIHPRELHCGSSGIFLVPRY